MQSQEISFSIVVPTYNSKKTIENCINKIKNSIDFFYNKNKNIKYELIVIDDGSIDKTLSCIPNFDFIKKNSLKKNRGVGYIRNLGARLSRYTYIYYVDSDILINDDTLWVLHHTLLLDNKFGTVGAIQKVVNHNNKDWGSDFVCLKTCYGFEKVEKKIEFTAIHSECCIISKNFLKTVGGWKYYSSAGGEEFELGHRIIDQNKKVMLTNETFYTTYYDGLKSRFFKVVDRTEKYVGIFLKRKKFEPKGAFATLNQSFSTFITLNIILLLILSLKFSLVVFIAILLLYFIQIIIELDFLFFSKKYFGLKIIPLCLFGIQIINLAIILGTLKFILKKVFKF